MFTYQTNAGAVTAKGVEFELQTVPVSGLNIKGTLALQNANYGSFVFPNPFPRVDTSDPRLVPGTNNLNLIGTQVQQNPRARGSVGVGYDIDLGDRGTVTPFLQEYFSSKFSANDVVYGRDAVSIQPGYHKTDLRVYWLPRNRHYSVQAFVENLENTAVITRVTRGGDNFIQGGYAAPRTAGVKIHLKY